MGRVSRVRRTAASLLLAHSLGTVLGGCVATPAQQVAALSPAETSTAARARQTRSFDTTDRALMMQATLGALQDLGFTIDESEGASGVIVGSKAASGLVRAQVTVRAAPGRDATLVRATFQRLIPRPGAQVDIGETLDDPALYQGFFEKISQSAFLTANDI